jgi:hypothetical protein
MGFLRARTAAGLSSEGDFHFWMLLWHSIQSAAWALGEKMAVTQKMMTTSPSSGRPQSSEALSRRFFLNKRFPPTLWVPIIIALVSFWYTTIDAGRRDRLEFVRGQIAHLYGPLYSLVRTEKHLWERLGKNDSNNTSKFLAEVASPLNRRIEDVVLSSGEVIRCEPILKDLHQFFVFAESAKLASTAESAKPTAQSAQLAAPKPTSDLEHARKDSYPRHFAAHLCAQLTILKNWEKTLNHPVRGLFFFPTVDDPDCKAVSDDTPDTCDPDAPAR